MTVKRLTPWLDTQLPDLDGEEWRDVTGYEYQYQVSSHGRVKSLARLDSRGQALRARILRQQLTRKGEYTINLYREGVSHTLAVLAVVGQAFLPKNGRPLVYIRRNKAQCDNRVSNLQLGTQSESVKLSIALGKFCAGPGNAETGNYMVHQAREHLQQHGIFREGVLVAKICKTCRIEQPLSNYYMQKGRTDLSCKACVLASRKCQKNPPVAAQSPSQLRAFFFNQYGSCVEPEVVMSWQRSRTVSLRITVAQHPKTGWWAAGGEVCNGSNGGNIWPCGVRSAYHTTGPHEGYATRTEAIRGMYTRIFSEAGDILSTQMLEVLRDWAHGSDWWQVRDEPVSESHTAAWQTNYDISSVR